MVGTRKRKDFFEDFGSELFDNLEDMIEALMEEMGESVPFVYGFSIIHRPGEELNSGNSETFRNTLKTKRTSFPQKQKSL